MVLDFAKAESLFEKLQDGNRDVLVEIIEAERARVYDFLLRMTGLRDRSLEVLDEVTKALSSHPEQFKDLQALRVSLYATVRSFISEAWNADVSQLINEGFTSLENDASANKADLTQLKNLEKQLCNIPGWEREPILLRLRCGFHGSEVADIMGVDEPSAGYSFKSGVAKVGRSLDLDFDSVENLIGKLPAHPLSAEAPDSTVALSQIMGDIVKARSGLGMSWRMPLVIAVLIAIAAYFLFYY